MLQSYAYSILISIDNYTERNIRSASVKFAEVFPHIRHNIH